MSWPDVQDIYMDSMWQGGKKGKNASKGFEAAKRDISVIEDEWKVQSSFVWSVFAHVCQTCITHDYNVITTLGAWRTKTNPVWLKVSDNTWLISEEAVVSP